MKNRVLAILLVMCSLVMAAGVVYADLKKGYYRPAELGSVQQAAPIELSPDSNYQASAYPVPAVDLTPGGGLQEVQIYCNTCHSPRYITMQPQPSAQGFLRTTHRESFCTCKPTIRPRTANSRVEKGAQHAAR
jgi:hypothetical protein